VVDLDKVRRLLRAVGCPLLLDGVWVPTEALLSAVPGQR
jgi:hypothetical protein